MSIVNTAQYTALYDKHACYYMEYGTSRCKKTGKACHMFLVTGKTAEERNNIADECDAYINHNDAVRISAITPKLRTLINEAREEGKMVFVEHGDPSYTMADLHDIECDIILAHPSLYKYVQVDRTGREDCMITIFEGVGTIIVD